jgi:hypothetical protein
MTADSLPTWAVRPTTLAPIMANYRLQVAKPATTARFGSANSPFLKAHR